MVFLVFTVKRIMLPLLIVVATYISHKASAVLVLVMCVVSFVLALVPGIYETRFKATINILMEMYTLMIGCTFILYLLIDD